MTSDMSPISKNQLVCSKGSDDESRDSSVHRKGNGTKSKLGRKGDPRMHRAVAARLANPGISLLSALRIGGFDYPDDDTGDDGTIIDKDNITLGQRKNQLSRRCRLAKQQKGDKGHQTRRNGSIGSQAISVEAQAELQKIMQHSSEAQNLTSPSKGRKRRGSELTLSEDEADDEAAMQEETAHRMAKFHPQYHPLFVPPASVTAAAGAPAASTGAWGASSLTGEAGPSWLGSSAAAERLFNAAASFSGHSTVSATGSHLHNHDSLNHLPSGVALASLNSTAGAVGLTLEQLAVKLSSASNLTNVFADQSTQELKEQLALNLYRTECSTLYQRCMLLAGYDSLESQEKSLTYKEFAIRAWSAEGRRLQQRIGIDIGYLPSLATLPSEAPAAADDSHSHLHGHAHAHVHSTTNEDKECFDGRHVHRLEGKCGHKAIIHQPDGAPAHVDFLIDGKVECYEGIKPVGTSAALWPSRYKCAQLSCPTDSSPHRVTCGQQECENECAALAQTDPKLLQMSDIDLDGKEWNASFFENDNGPMDNSLLGLIGLAGSEEGKQGKTEAED